MDAIQEIKQQDIKYIDVKEAVQTQFCQTKQINLNDYHVEKMNGSLSSDPIMAAS
jgi:hypothetical protein